MVDYNKRMQTVFYTETKEIEILERREGETGYKYPAVLYFRNVGELIDLLKTSPAVWSKIVGSEGQ